MVTFLLVLGMAGCGFYYQVRDPAGSGVYYTTDLKKRPEGTIKFKDAKTGAEATLQNLEVKEISKDEFKAKTKKQA